MPGQLGHVLEVHPVNPGHSRRKRQDRRPGGKFALHQTLSRRLQQQTDFNGLAGDITQAGEILQQAVDVDRHVAKVRAHVFVDKRERQALQLLADLHHGCHVAAQAQQLTAQAVNALDVFLP